MLILHGSAGIDGRGEFHGKALNAAGIATLEIFMFSRGNRPRGGRNENLTHMYGALKYLASRPEIDRGRIGVMGFSWGGGLSLTAASASTTQLFTDGQVRFAAHAPFYPVCWSHLRMTSDAKASGYGRYKTLTGAPVMPVLAEVIASDAAWLVAMNRTIDARNRIQSEGTQPS